MARSLYSPGPEAFRRMSRFYTGVWPWAATIRAAGFSSPRDPSGSQAMSGASGFVGASADGFRLWTSALFTYDPVKEHGSNVVVALQVPGTSDGAERCAMPGIGLGFHRYPINLQTLRGCELIAEKSVTDHAASKY